MAVSVPADSHLSVVVTTCAMADRAARCVASVLACVPPPLEVIVVENRPVASQTASVLRQRFPGEERLRCVTEPRRGLSNARNRGLQSTRGELVAFTDDDVLVESCWIGAIEDAFAGEPEAMCVTGPILAQALKTSEQRIFERFARLSKGEERAVYCTKQPPAGDVLFPYAAGRFGSGANIAMRTSFAREIGGFEVTLGAGTRALGGEDLDLFIRVLRFGAKLVYEPRAAVRHEHVDTLGALRRHAFHYGVGLSAMLTRQLLDRAQRRELLRRVPAGFRYLLDPASAKNAARGRGYPRALSLLEWLGFAVGPFAYLASVLAQSRQRSPR